MANATVTRRTLSDLAQALSLELGEWIAQNVSFVGTSVDRITPKTTAAEIEWVRSTAAEDALQWSLSHSIVGCLAGIFRRAAALEEAGAQVVEEIVPYETRATGC